MPYDPHAPSERERSNAYFMVWIGLAASLAIVAATLLPFSDRLRGLAALIVGVELLIFAVSTRFDSYFQQLRNSGAVVALAIVALWLAVNGVVHMGDVSYAVGVAIGSDGAAADPARTALPAILTDAWLVASVAVAGFHVGFLFAHWRGGR